MANNRYTGETEVRIAGQTYTLLYDWKGLAELRTINKEHNLFSASGEFDPERVAKVLEIGFRRYHSDMTAEKIMDISPPFMEVMEMIDRAMNRAAYGQDTPPVRETTDPQA
jgi:hypothetical protein